MTLSDVNVCSNIFSTNLRKHIEQCVYKYMTFCKRKVVCRKRKKFTLADCCWDFSLWIAKRLGRLEFLMLTFSRVSNRFMFSFRASTNWITQNYYWETENVVTCILLFFKIINNKYKVIFLNHSKFKQKVSHTLSRLIRYS